ncbi:MAG: hypothetical protein HKN33_15460 [Pyrinomonadaceae bacterium]|nr:hypothetical protein [Pyrinomonadaceae bacterium]
MDEICFWDKRLKGTKDLFKTITTFELSTSTSIHSAFNFLKARQKLIGRKINKLYILSHGEVGSKKLKILGHTHEYDYYFTGTIQLGKENLDLWNVSKWKSIRGLVDIIVVYSCMAAHTGKGKTGEIKDGKLLMSRLAKFTDAIVFAGEKSELYDKEGLNMGKWTGRVFQFDPNGTYKQVSGGALNALTGKI